MLNLGPQDTLYDLGAGDGRVVLCAAKWYGTVAVGVEVDDALLAAAAAHIENEPQKSVSKPRLDIM